MSVTIRPATEADTKAILPMVAALCAHHQTIDPQRFAFVDGVAERYRLWLPQRAADPRSVLLIAKDGRKAAGFVVGSVEKAIPIYTVREFGWIHDLWVEPKFRRAGVARMLVRAAMARFAAMGVEQVRLETAAINETARRAFIACGFRTSAVEMLVNIRPASP